MSTEDSDNQKTIWQAAVDVHYLIPSSPPEPLEPIWKAAAYEDWETVKQLLDSNPLLIAVTDKSDFGTIYQIVGETRRTLLHMAARSANVEVLKYLVSKGADVNAEDIDRRTPLYEAARCHSNANALEYLVSQGADVNADDVYGITPLHNAACNPNIELLYYLVSQVADVNAKDVEGQTPLHKAASNPNIEVLKYLVSKGADVNVKDAFGNTPHDLADTNEKKNFLRKCMQGK